MWARSHNANVWTRGNRTPVAGSRPFPFQTARQVPVQLHVSIWVKEAMDIRMMLGLLYDLGQLRRHERWSRAQLETYQTESLHRLREYAYGHSPFYQGFHQGLYDRPLSELPVLTKAMMMEHFDELVTDRTLHLEQVRAFAAQGQAAELYQGRYWVNATSGSSGHPGIFLFNQREWIAVLASFARSQEWSGVHIDLTHRQRMATVASISPWHMSSQVGAAVKSWWRPSLRLPASQPLSRMVEQLNDWQPEVLIAYASMISILAEEQLAGRLYIHPRVTYAASEVLTRRRARAPAKRGVTSLSTNMSPQKRLASRGASTLPSYALVRRLGGH